MASSAITTLVRPLPRPSCVAAADHTGSRYIAVLIYGSLRVPTLDRFAQVTHVSTALSVVACLCMSTSGFLVFTNKTPGNILNAFAEDDTLINIARAFVSFRRAVPAR